MLTGRKSVGRRAALFVCIERRTVRIVRRAASSQGCKRVCLLGRKSGERLGGCLPQKGKCCLFVPDAAWLWFYNLAVYSTRGLLPLVLFRNPPVFSLLRLELGRNPWVDIPASKEICC
jgi:hypothetical protein